MAVGRTGAHDRGGASAGTSGMRLAALVLGLGGATLVLGGRAAALAPTALSAAGRVEHAVELAVLTGAALAAAWVAFGAVIGLAVVVASRLGFRWRTGEAAVRRLAPGVVRRLVRAGVGVSVGAGMVLGPTAAFAAQPGPADEAVVSAGSPVAHSGEGTAVVPGGFAAAVPGGFAAAVDLTWQPTAPAPTTPPVLAEPVAARVTPARAHHGDARVVVRGDTLWDIAAEALGGAPSDAATMAAMTRWHAANRDVIGPDPDRILPGQVLRPPA